MSSNLQYVKFQAFDLLPNDYDTAVGKGFLLCEGMGVVVPTSLGEFWEDVFSTGISFGNHKSTSFPIRGICFRIWGTLLSSFTSFCFSKIPSTLTLFTAGRESQGVKKSPFPPGEAAWSILLRPALRDYEGQVAHGVNILP